MLSVALLDQLQKHFIFQLLSCRLAQGNQVLDKPKYIVQLWLLPNADDHLENF